MRNFINLFERHTMRYNKALRKTVIELCRKTNKPILKLTYDDYVNNGLKHLFKQYGSYDEINVLVFDELQHTITGWPGGNKDKDDSQRPVSALPYPKKVLVFSPHPDDDVISMGGTIKKLAKQGHEVHVAYQTSGNIAVDNVEVTRYMLFLEKLGKLPTVSQSSGAGQNNTLDCKALNPEQVASDSALQLSIKGIIRKVEAQLACADSGIPAGNIHFLDMPFYETGKVEKNPVSQADKDIIFKLLMDIKPNMIFIAGDLADPHGTHRVCTETVMDVMQDIKLQSQSQQAETDWITRCDVWMYRGAWEEYDVTEIDMAVPMSPEELKSKRDTILKHQSQMDNAPYLGSDNRLFWQRSEERNRTTATVYDQLGMCCYEAIEAFVKWEM